MGRQVTQKVADRSHTFLNAQFNALSRIDDIDSKALVLVGLPVVVFFYLGKGSTVVLRHKKLLKPRKMKAILNEYQVTHITDSPSFMLKYQAFFSIAQANRIEMVVTGGGPVFNEGIELLRHRFSKACLKIVYGSTEVEPISVKTIALKKMAYPSTCKALNAGTIDQEIALKIGNFSKLNSHQVAAKEFDDCLLKEGEIGEIVVSGPHVLNNYFNSKAVYTAQKIEAGPSIWHKTGDSGFIKDGELFLTGPINQLIRQGDHIISPFMTESYLNSVSSINRGTVICVDGKIWLLLVMKTNQAFDLRDLALDFTVDEVKIIKEMPLDPRHKTKIDYKALENLVSESVINH